MSRFSRGTSQSLISEPAVTTCTRRSGVRSTKNSDSSHVARLSEGGEPRAVMRETLCDECRRFDAATSFR